MRTMTVEDAESRFAEVVATVRSTKESVVVEDQGTPVAVLISPEDYSRLRHQERESDFAIVETLRSRFADVSPEETEREVDRVLGDASSGRAHKA
jgi:prevent-host-death family protein